MPRGITRLTVDFNEYYRTNLQGLAVFLDVSEAAVIRMAIDDMISSSISAGYKPPKTPSALPNTVHTCEARQRTRVCRGRASHKLRVVDAAGNDDTMYVCSAHAATLGAQKSVFRRDHTSVRLAQKEGS
jgi:hypothetical protein